MPNLEFIAANYDTFEKVVAKEKGSEKPRKYHAINHLVEVFGWDKDDAVLACNTWWFDIKEVRYCYNTKQFNEFLDTLKASIEGLKIVTEMDHDIILRGLSGVESLIKEIKGKFEEDKKKFEEM